MASDLVNEDSWLYGGDSNLEAPEEPDKDEEINAEDVADATPGTEVDELPIEAVPESVAPPPIEDAAEEPMQEDLPPGVEPECETEEAATTAEDKENDDGSDKDSDDDSDDDVNVVIGDIKTSATYTSLNIKRANLVSTTSGVDKLKQTGKFSIDEFETIGSINGISAQEYNLDSLEDKPWRKPGADITDYFNYGFNEDTWRSYCERQKRMRVHESGVGLAPMNSIGLPRTATSITNDNSKYSGNFTGPRKAGPPPGRRMTGSIDVIGGNSGLASRRGLDTPLAKTTPPKENVIQVMTADRREYSRKPGFPDMSVPPPGAPFEPVDISMPPPGFDNYPPATSDFFNPEPEPYYGGYEPTQDVQWAPTADPNWVPTEIKTLTPGPAPVPVPAPVMAPPVMVPPPVFAVPEPTVVPAVPENFTPPSTRDRDDASPARSESRSRSEKPDRHRERSHRPRDRSRSRSRRHKSRSRSPSHRSHRKKKSRRHDKDDSD